MQRCVWKIYGCISLSCTLYLEFLIRSFLKRLLAEKPFHWHETYRSRGFLWLPTVCWWSIRFTRHPCAAFTVSFGSKTRKADATGGTARWRPDPSRRSPGRRRGLLLAPPSQEQPNQLAVDTFCEEDAKLILG